LTFRWARAGNSWRMAVVGAAWGIALLTKFTALLLLPVLAALLLLHRWRKWRELVIESSLLLSMTWLTVNLGMGLDGSFSRLDGYHLVSQFGGQVQQALPGWLPVPLPRSYVLGFDQQKQDAEQSELFGSYLFGVWSTKGWWYYNLVALVVKNPLPIVAMVLIAPLLWRRLPVPRIAAAEVWAPLLTLLASMLLFNRLNIGVRYLLPIFPLNLLVAAAAWQGRQKWQPWLAGGLLALHVATAALVHPDYLTYFNLAVGGPGNGHLVLLDSNLDWGQDLYRVPQALASMGHRGPVKLLYFGHVPPEMYGLQYELPGPEPAEGMFAVSLQYLMGGDYVALAPDGRSQPIPPGYIAWLRQFSPAAKAGTIWVFDVRSTRK
jgi:4-amino-4-deoxy-L-arabinose transferase-like glycosyltransferase